MTTASNAVPCSGPFVRVSERWHEALWGLQSGAGGNGFGSFHAILELPLTSLRCSSERRRAAQASARSPLTISNRRTRGSVAIPSHVRPGENLSAALVDRTHESTSRI